MTLIARISIRQRTAYPKPFKAQVVQECLQPGATVSRVAISHGINANVIRKWLPLYRDHTATTSLPALVPLEAAPKRLAETSVIIELPMAGQLISVKWPALDPEGCAQFIRAFAQ
ncbi:IS66-like element accessory protein TnpA [Pseudomonas sp. NPDC089401]|uniref:IS66-like element accessory protein TnpA n=1 Tax=Pseudomonas sp. NPDC089401 TaxID=3364462 RepID=UPI0037F74257